MIESIKDLELDDLDPKNDDFKSKLDEKLKEKLNISVKEMQDVLSTSLISSSADIAGELNNIIAYNDYDKIIEDENDMVEFLKNEASKPENFWLYGIQEDNGLLKFHFINMAVDEGDVVNGFVFVSKGGKIKHYFVTC